jgi:homoserine kinase type II
MAIFTPLNKAAITRLLQEFHALPPGPFTAAGVAMGTVNTYYRVRFAGGEVFYLKIDEVGDEKRLRNELAILSHLSHQHVRLPFVTPAPLPTRSGGYFIPFQQKFCLVFPELRGRILFENRLTTRHLHQIGRALACLHQLPTARAVRAHRFDLAGQRRVFAQIRFRLARRHPKIERFIVDKFSQLAAHRPRGDKPVLIHADLFAENIHWVGARLNGILDFEAAGAGPALFDVSVCLHALCHGRQGFQRRRIAAFLSGYQRVRSLPRAAASWRYYLEQSALRFLLTRLRDFELAPATGRAEPFKDYREFVTRFDEIARLALPAIRSH